MAEREGEEGGAPDPGGFGTPDAMRLATDYLARYAASSHHLRQVLARKIRRWHERRDLVAPEAPALGHLVDETVSRLVQLGLLDDGAFALARARRLVAKGLPQEEVRRRLAADRLDPRAEALDDVVVADEAAQARRFAARKRLGPFRTGARAPFRDKDIRRLARAGFSFREAVAAIDGPADAHDETSAE